MTNTQAKSQRGGNRNPTGKGGFQERPEDRGRGFWKRESTPRYKLEKMMELEEDELRAIAEDKKAPLFERKLAVAIRKGEWREIKEMIQEVYGKPKESVDLTHHGDVTFINNVPRPQK